MVAAADMMATLTISVVSRICSAESEFSPGTIYLILSAE
jgi:hypothetical protein